MHHSYEKGGLVIDNQPIPWNADAVIVECLARLPGAAVRRKEEFILRIPGREPVQLDNLRRDEAQDRYRLFFRFPPPAQSTNAEVIWRHRRLGEMTLVVVERAQFLDNLHLQHATLAVELGEQTVACQAFVTSQCRGLSATALLSSPTSLAPLADLGLHVDWRLEGEAEGQQFPVHMSSTQMKAKQALLTVHPSRLPKKAGQYVVSWKIEEQVLATQRIKAISKTQFVRSLRISDTRLVLQTAAGVVRLARQMPALEGIARVGPCFLVSSSEVGMAGLCPLSIHAQFAGGAPSPVLLAQELLVTDGPAPFVPGTLDAQEVAQIKAFELRAGAISLGHLPLTPAPVAAFDAEGGFKSLPAYSWSAAAEGQLQEKLAKLLGPQRNGK